MYKVFGYTDDFYRFEKSFESFVKAYYYFKERDKCDITFMVRGTYGKKTYKGYML
jgi:hypothetical protein